MEQMIIKRKMDKYIQNISTMEYHITVKMNQQEQSSKTKAKKQVAEGMCSVIYIYVKVKTK